MLQRDHYKHYIALTSQVQFCQVPLRLDSYNQCSFSCTYCFAKSRGGYRGTGKLQITDPNNLIARFERIESGLIRSAVDEFIDRRIPIQFGGMTDPFSPLEEHSGTSLKILEILSERRYPTLISTKGSLVRSERYAELLSTGNYLVRFSISILPEATRAIVEPGMESYGELLEAIEHLTGMGVACAVRLQPVFPTFEYLAFDIVKACQRHGAKHVTFEYLKLPVDDLNAKLCEVRSADGRTMIQVYREANAERQGRELVLPAVYKLGFVREISTYARELGITVGFGDNEFLPFSDGKSCCNGADLHLSNSNIFDANVASIVRSKSVGQKIQFSDIATRWTPQKPIEPYLNSKSRLSSGESRLSWLDIVEHHWRADNIYMPSYFFGVSKTDEIDEHGLSVFVRTREIL